jgi:hypothetical protein
MNKKGGPVRGVVRHAAQQHVHGDNDAQVLEGYEKKKQRLKPI